MLLLTPTISSLMLTPQHKAEFQNAQRSMKTWGDLKAYFEHGAKKSVGEHTQAAKQLFHPIDDPSLVKETTIAGFMREIRKTLLRLGVSD